MIVSRRAGVSTSGLVGVAVILALLIVSLSYMDSTQGQSQSVTNLQNELRQLKAQVSVLNGTLASSLHVMDEAPAIRTVRETWYLSPSSHQDRFDPSFIVVNQGDTVRLTFVDNDTVAHDFVIGPPYSIIVNASVPGLVNDLTGQTFTQQAMHNSPGAVTTGSPGNVTARDSFVASTAGIFEFVCTYHVQVGMFGYLVVLPNKAYNGETNIGHVTDQAGNVTVDIRAGSATPDAVQTYVPQNLTVVVGINSTVEWVNNDGAPHTVTATNGGFDSGNMDPGQSWAFTFTAPGVYRYHCSYHPWMFGTVTVKQP
jgi:plastocyanin